MAGRVQAAYMPAPVAMDLTNAKIPLKSSSSATARPRDHGVPIPRVLKDDGQDGKRTSTLSQ